MAAAAALAVLDLADDPDLLRRVRELGGRLTEQLGALRRVTEVRGRGLMLGLGLDGDDSKEIAARALERGLVINAPEPATLRLLPPLMITEDDAAQAVEILSELLG